MRFIKNSQKPITSALEELGAERGIWEAGFGGKQTIEGKDPVGASDNNRGKSEVVKDNPGMKFQTEIPFVNTTIIPDRNAGIGSLLLDLQNSKDTECDGPLLSGREFAFIDVGASCARVSTTLKTLLTRDLRMNVDYVATERLDVVPFSYITPPGERAEKIRRFLSSMISTRESTREVMDWHYVVNQAGKVSSVSYSYNYYGNEVWEAYFMGLPFMISGERVEFRDPTLDEMLAPDVQNIEAIINQERKQLSDQLQPAPLLDSYRKEKNPLEAGLAECGITLQKIDVPQRVKDRQNVLFLGNVINQYPQDKQARELVRIAANMHERDIVIVQADEMEASFIEVFQIKGHGERRKLERVRYINTIKLVVEKPRVAGSSQQIHLKPVLAKVVNHLIDCLGTKVIANEWSQENQKAIVQQYFNQVFRAFFRALPVEATLRIAIREALRRLPSGGGLKGIPVFKDDANDAFGGALGLDTCPIVSEADLVIMKMASANVIGEEVTRRLGDNPVFS